LYTLLINLLLLLGLRSGHARFLFVLEASGQGALLNYAGSLTHVKVVAAAETLALQLSE
jgi:hypothetical protein